jgi:hypothetical protein
LNDLNGNVHPLGEYQARRVRAFVFLSTECPVSNSYTRTLNELASRYAKAETNVELFGVISDPTVSRSVAEKHFREYAAKFPVLFDDAGLLAQALAPTHVPEAFVLDGTGTLVYRGAIDDMWEQLGRRRTIAQRQYLADALHAARDGKTPNIRRTKPVGCLFER